ncbi:MAG: hypothetical protein IJM79_02725 [Erysipelotrichaceae bacterium]|nr:hypothetical protein [Erysipelotrichaceae bacterium]
MDNSNKPKYKIRWNAVIPMAICLILIIYLLVSLIIGLFFKGGREMDIYKIGKYSGRQTYELIMKEDRANPVPVYDYNYYGESLNLYFDYYSLDLPYSTMLRGKTLVLKDFCSDKVITLDNFTEMVDAQIDLSGLPDGFYGVYLMENEISERVYLNQTVSFDDEFYTVTREGKNRHIQLLANQKLFDTADAETSVLDRNYLYIKVETVGPETYQQYDIAINTAPAMSGDVAVSPKGEERNGIVEAQEMYDLAQAIAGKLTAEGYKVLILKESYNENVLYYGADGLLKRAVDAGVKYMINLDMEIDSTIPGVIYSNYTTNGFARSIFTKLMADTELFSDESRLHPCKLVTSSLLSDGLNYDQDWVIREAGGAVLGGGRFSATSQKNASFEASNVYGINTVSIRLCNIKDSVVVDRWLKNKDAAAQAIAEGIINYLKK